MLVHLYRFLTLLAAPFIRLYLLKRRVLGKEHDTRIGERFGHAGFARPDGPLVWLHAASVGEAHSVVPLIKKLLELHPQLNVLLTTGTVTSAQIMDTKLPERAYHQFVPVDTWFAVSRFLKHWKPDMALWAESEIWPNLIILTYKQGIPMALINARMSPKSYAWWCRFPVTLRSLVRRFDLICPQSTEDADKYRHFYSRNIEMLGNLKHDSPPLPADSREMGVLLAQIGDRPVWIAASTHNGEEKAIAEAHQTLKTDHPGLLTIVAPRHPQRGAKIVTELAEAGLGASLRSRKEPITENTDIYVADTIGELGIFYRIASIVFIGGSLVPHGGQNPLEPARLDCALLTGPHTDNFISVCAELEEKKALLRVYNATDLARTVGELLRDNEKQELLAKAALQCAESKQGVLVALITRLTPLMEHALKPYPAIKKPERSPISEEEKEVC